MTMTTAEIRRLRAKALAAVHNPEVSEDKDAEELEDQDDTGSDQTDETDETGSGAGDDEPDADEEPVVRKTRRGRKK